MYTALSYICAAATRELLTTPDLKSLKAIRAYLRKLSARQRLSSEIDPMLKGLSTPAAQAFAVRGRTSASQVPVSGLKNPSTCGSGTTLGA